MISYVEGIVASGGSSGAQQRGEFSLVRGESVGELTVSQSGVKVLVPFLEEEPKIVLVGEDSKIVQSQLDLSDCNEASL